MPSISKQQHRFMSIAADDAAFAKKFNINQDVAKEYLKEDLELYKVNPGYYELLPEKANDDSFKEEESNESKWSLAFMSISK